ncbi:MAG: hypothetical protein EAX96_21170 [Candidatus Lokiarchaeota archaeon]|nr:hypothetical protein [Candidatus Lokiarchaeota archaeon]
MKEETEFVELQLLLPHALASEMRDNRSNEIFSVSFLMERVLKRFGMDFFKILRELITAKDLSIEDIFRALKRESNLKRAPKRGGPINWVKFYSEIIIESESMDEKAERFERANKQLLKRSRQRLKKFLKENDAQFDEMLSYIKIKEEQEKQYKKELYHSLYLMDELLKKANDSPNK